MKHEFLEELDISENTLASAIGVPYSTIDRIIHEKYSITADINLRLSHYFRLSEGYFLRLQNAYELMEAKRILGERLKQIIPHASLTNVSGT